MSEWQRTVAKLDNFNEKDYRGLEGTYSWTDDTEYVDYRNLYQMQKLCVSSAILHAQSSAIILSASTNTFGYC